MRVAALGQNHAVTTPVDHSISRIRFRAFDSARRRVLFFEIRTYLIRPHSPSSDPARESHRQSGLIETPERQAGTSTLLAK
jgi:hypothetical protein